jgi:energy-coupling factor transporter transmembrane protein EcfT
MPFCCHPVGICCCFLLLLFAVAFLLLLFCCCFFAVAFLLLLFCCCFFLLLLPLSRLFVVIPQGSASVLAFASGFPGSSHKPQEKWLCLPSSSQKINIQNMAHFQELKQRHLKHHIHHAKHHKFTTNSPRPDTLFSQKPLQKPPSTTPKNLAKIHSLGCIIRSKTCAI